MKRKQFIKTCGLACIGATTIGTFLQGCVASKQITVNITDGKLIIPKTDFLKNETYLEYVIVRNEQLNYPIYVFRFSEQDYSALYLQCSHQGYELNAYGDKLVCSAHGSEFNNRGIATNGPATDPLRSFPVQIENQHILISLKKI